MFYTLFPQKDSVITDVSLNGVSKTGSNVGASEVLELYALTSSADAVGKSRILLYFDISTLSASIASGETPIGATFKLQMKNAPHAEETPYSYDLEVCPLSQSWTEGRGLSMFDEGLRDGGVVNWSKATTIQNWSISGSSYFSSSALTSSQYFETGLEDLNCDISNIVRAWVSGTIPNHGVVIKFPQVYETLNEDLYVKKFFSRNVHATERLPMLTALWDDSTQDDRSNIKYNVSGTLFYYRNINGQLTSLNSPVYVNIVNSSSAVVQTLTASTDNTGIYYITGVLAPFTSSTTIYRDVWFSGTTQFFTGTFQPTYETGSVSLNSDSLTLNLPNLQTYTFGTRTLVRVFARNKDYRPAMASYAGKDPEPILLKNAYYQILNAETEDVIIDFSTGSLKYSKLSYDKSGNYFILRTDSLRPEYIYKIKILVDWVGQTQVFDKGFNFKIES